LPIVIALGFQAACGTDDETPATQTVTDEPVLAPAALPRCRALDRSSCSAKGHVFACDGGGWHPAGRPGQTGHCVCDGTTQTCG